MPVYSGSKRALTQRKDKPPDYYSKMMGPKGPKVFIQGIYVPTPQKLSLWKSRGFNSIFDIQGGYKGEDYIVPCAQNQMYSLRAASNNPYLDRNDPWLLAYAQPDEPKFHGLSPGLVKSITDGFVQNGGPPWVKTICNHIGNYIWVDDYDFWYNDKEMRSYVAGSDLLCGDVYPFNDLTYSVDSGFPAGSGLAVIDNVNALGGRLPYVSTIEGRMLDVLRDWCVALNVGDKPVMGFYSGVDYAGNGNLPTRQQMARTAVSYIIHNAIGVNCFSVKESPFKDDILTDDHVLETYDINTLISGMTQYLVDPVNGGRRLNTIYRSAPSGVAEDATRLPYGFEACVTVQPNGQLFYIILNLLASTTSLTTTKFGGVSNMSFGPMEFKIGLLDAWKTYTYTRSQLPTIGWDLANKNSDIQISLDGLTATTYAGNDYYRIARGRTPIPKTGKSCFEILINHTDGSDSFQLGTISTSNNYAAKLSALANRIALNQQDGFHINTTAFNEDNYTAVPLADGDKITFASDSYANTVSVYKNQNLVITLPAHDAISGYTQYPAFSAHTDLCSVTISENPTWKPTGFGSLASPNTTAPANSGWDSAVKQSDITISSDGLTAAVSTTASDYFRIIRAKNAIPTTGKVCYDIVINAIGGDGTAPFDIGAITDTVVNTRLKLHNNSFCITKGEGWYINGSDSGYTSYQTYPLKAGDRITFAIDNTVSPSTLTLYQNGQLLSNGNTPTRSLTGTTGTLYPAAGLQALNDSVTLDLNPTWKPTGFSGIV